MGAAENVVYSIRIAENQKNIYMQFGGFMHLQNSNFDEWLHIVHNTYLPVLFISVNDTQNSHEWGLWAWECLHSNFQPFYKITNRKINTFKNRLYNWSLDKISFQMRYNMKKKKKKKKRFDGNFWAKIRHYGFWPKKITFSHRFSMAPLLISFYTYWRYTMWSFALYSQFEWYRQNSACSSPTIRILSNLRDSRVQ